jgi:V/A-type H+-transporting ATPase subunit I
VAVERMRFVNIAGKISEMDEFVINSIVPYDIQLENAINILDTVKGLYPFSEENPYERLNGKVSELLKVLDHKMEYDPTKTCALMPVSLLEPEIDGYERQLETIQKIRRNLKADLEHKKEIRKQIVPIQNLEVEVDRMFKFKYMKFRFGKMPKESFDKLFSYIKNLDIIAYQVSEEHDSVYLVYFTPRMMQGNIDSLFASLFFERIRISEDVKGYPKEALQRLDEEIEELENRVAMLDKDSKEFVERNFDRLQELYNFTIQLNEVFEVRRYAVRSKEAFYLTGWIPESQVESFGAMVNNTKHVTCIFEDDSAVKKAKPPTKLKNNKFFRPFESLIEMYGTPSYNELDPTPFVGITYILFFALMFGDVGQGLVIALISYLFYRKAKKEVIKLGIYLGIASAITGVIYDSIFGFEGIIGEATGLPTVHVMEHQMEVLGFGIGLGVLVITIALIFNMINKYKQDKLAKLLFDRNGLAGFIFYMAFVYIAISVIMQWNIPAYIIILFMIGPLVIMFMAHPLENIMKRHKYIFPEDKSGFVIETFFEMVETIIAVISNTVSFMRVGAFALNHVGFFMAFHALADIVDGTGSIFVMIFGNVLIIILEGMIVGIQGLRLAYYEMFSKFFEGDGQAFKPFKIKG